MTNETVANVTAQKKASDALTRVKTLEEKVGQLYDVVFGTVREEKRVPGAFEALSKEVDTSREQASQMVEVLDAVVSLLGVDAVSAKINETRLERLKSDAAAQRDQLAKSVELGQLVADGVVEDTSIITCTQTKLDGTAIEPGWFMYPIYMIKSEDVKRDLLGKRPGESITVDGTHVLEVTGVYNRAPEAK